VFQVTEATDIKLKAEMKVIAPIQLDGKKKDPALVIFVNDETEKSIEIILNQKMRFRTLARGKQIQELLNEFLTKEILQHLAEMSEREKLALNLNNGGEITK
jgi:hypothetical protein